MSRVYVIRDRGAAGRAEANEPAARPGEVPAPGSEPSAAAGETNEPVNSCVVLIDRRRLRRSWVMACLEAWRLGGRVEALSSAAEIGRWPAAGDRRIDLVIASVGGATVDDPAVAEDLRWLREQLPEVPVVLLADREDPASVAAAMRTGVRGYLPTSTEPEVARRALALVLAGGSYAPPGLLLGTAAEDRTESCGSAIPSLAAGTGRLDGLTPRQREVLALLGQGRPNKVIAQRLSMCESTVKVHVRQIMRKLGASNRTEVALKLRELLATDGAAAS